jgi:hypothetical protein
VNEQAFRGYATNGLYRGAKLSPTVFELSPQALKDMWTFINHRAQTWTPLCSMISMRPSQACRTDLEDGSYLSAANFALQQTEARDVRLGC